MVTALISGVIYDENEDQTELTIQKQQQQQQPDGVNPAHMDCNCDEVFVSCDTATSMQRLDTTTMPTGGTPDLLTTRCFDPQFFIKPLHPLTGWFHLSIVYLPIV